MKLKPIVIAMASTLWLAGCQQDTTDKTTATPEAEQKQTMQQKAAATESERLAQFFEDSFQTSLKESPMYQSYLGLKWDYGSWDEVTDAQTQKGIDRLKQELEALAKFDESQLSEQEKLSKLIFEVDSKRQLANDEFRHHDYIMHQFRAFHTMVPSFLINIHRVSEKSDAEAYVSRLDSVETLFDQVIEQLRIREKLGVFPPKWSYEQMIQASENVITGQPFSSEGEDSTIWADFKSKVEKLEIDQAEKDSLLADAKKALLTSVKPAYEKMIAELDKQMQITPEGDGVWRLPDGDKWYKNRLEWFTTTDLSADEVHNIGLKHVKRIHNEMRDIMKQVNFDGSLEEFFEFMRTDKQFYYENTDEGRERYMQEATALINKMRETLPEFFGLTPKANMIVKRVEAFREKSAGKAFYQRPTPDGSRPGIYYANLYDMNSMPTYQMEALAYHEGIPGHHMQIAIAQELEGVPQFQKFVSFTAYTEGWGLYTEQLSKEMGFYQDPYSDFGRLAMELWRACRLVVDTGIHAKKWSREKAIQYLIDNTPNPDEDSRKAIERYIAMPGQATAYMIGKLKIVEIRERLKKQLGDKFDIRGFHDEILKDGPVPMNILEDKLNAWAEKIQKS
ncbi:DUF885 domain-containing protein [Alteromonas sp. a30]|uniref:DUF885 domain-containing protein n=1 Tax=Alteromonas sp. a30 TaxID=2730917 RepID=UPI002DDC9405|nr:DUF885 domain-containing protein [Alteromonas sp. a30]MCY7295873.1 DUF885 domain-containing protein [Alteromonas sp. a30]